MRVPFFVVLGLGLMAGALAPDASAEDDGDIGPRIVVTAVSRISTCLQAGGIPIVVGGQYQSCAFSFSVGGGGIGAGLGFGSDFSPFVGNDGQGPNDERQGDCNDANTGDGAKSAKQGLVGNPVVVSTGSKVESEVDFETTGEMGLFLSRTYNSASDAIGLFGRHWSSNFDYKLTFGGYEVNACYPRPGGGSCAIGTETAIWAHRPNGVIVKFVKNATDGVFYEDKPSPVARIVVEADGRFRHYAEDNATELYSSAVYKFSNYPTLGPR